MKNTKLDEGQILIDDNIIADISLTILYKVKYGHVEISTENSGGGNYMKIVGINDKEKDVAIYTDDFDELLKIINHFKTSYKKLVTNSKIR